MAEPKETITKVAVESAKVVAKDIYEDGLKPLVTETGKILGSTAEVLNNVVMYPVRKVNEQFDKAEGKKKAKKQEAQKQE